VYFAYACATGSEEGGTGVDDAGSDAARDVASVLPNEDSGQRPSEDASATCTGKVVVNELMSQGTVANDEFAELYNPGSCAVEMSSWKLSYRSASGTASAMYTFPTGSQIASKAFLVLGRAEFTGKKDATITGSSMAADNGQVALLDDTGKVIDGVAYGTVDVGAAAGTYAEKTPAPAPVANGSISRKTDGVDTDDNQADFAKTSPPTPGAPNQ
jgi:hypothetical protein